MSNGRPKRKKKLILVARGGKTKDGRPAKVKSYWRKPPKKKPTFWDTISLPSGVIVRTRKKPRKR